MHKYWLLWHLNSFFHSWHGYKLIKTPKFLHFSYKQCQFTQNFAKQPYNFFVPKVLKIIFYPYKQPSQGQKLKTFPNHLFLGGHPVDPSILMCYRSWDRVAIYLQGVPQKMWFKLTFEFLTIGRVFLGVKNDSKNFGNKKKYRVA